MRLCLWCFCGALLIALAGGSCAYVVANPAIPVVTRVAAFSFGFVLLVVLAIEPPGEHQRP